MATTNTTVGIAFFASRLSPAAEVAGLFFGLLGFLFRPGESRTPGSIAPGEAASHRGQTVTVEGVATVHISPKAAFVDVDGGLFNQDFTAVIWPENEGQFGDLAFYSGKTVDVTGTVQDYRGKPEIIVREKSQLRAR